MVPKLSNLKAHTYLMYTCEKISEELALVKLRRSKKLAYGLKQNLRSNSTEFFVSETYVQELKNLNSQKKIYLLPAKFFEKLAVEKKRMHLLNAVGALL